MIYKLPEREMLNLVLDGKPFDRFAVTKASWENFLFKLSEKESLPSQQVSPATAPVEAVHARI
jgi:hypothetical protein